MSACKVKGEETFTKGSYLKVSIVNLLSSVDLYLHAFMHYNHRQRYYEYSPLPSRTVEPLGAGPPYPPTAQGLHLGHTETDCFVSSAPGSSEQVDSLCSTGRG